jgi:signal transduction histidine kinase/CheY-like chemotaxis protein/HPt (histidine-containing phosphotransfer) domain-containing protein
MFRLAVICLFLVSLFPAVGYAQTEHPEFTAEEEQFIKDHPVISLCVDPEFVPYEFVDTDGQYKGIAADYIKLLSEKTGIEMIPVKGISWAKAYEMAVEKKLDVLPCIAKTQQREQYFLFTQPYIDFQRVIVVQNTNNSIRNLSDLRNKTAAVQKNSSHHSYLAEEHPEIALNLYSTAEEALTMVSVGEEEAFIGNLATTSYMIKQHGFTNLKFIIINNQASQSLYFGVRNDWPELVGIMNKGLDSITEEEKMEINNKWIGVENEIDYGPVFKVIAVILLFLAISVFWTIRLRKEVRKRILIEEELRKAKQEAEIANQIKSSFLARMSHEIRTPLNAITGMSYLMKKTGINVTQKIYLDKINQAAYTMLGIINDILDFSKIESGKVELEIVPFNLDKVIQEVINIISFKIEEQAIRFRMSKDPEIPVNFFGDPKRIEQILINLISNAAKFTDRGEVSLEVSLIARSEAVCELEFRVRDTGIGMSHDQIERLFTPFVQGDSSINRRFGGTGLGLSIVKNMTELMNGVVTVESVPGEGSVFAIRLPLEVDVVKNSEEKLRTSILDFKKLRALVLDRSATDLHLIENYLASFGIPVELTESETGALKLLATQSDREYKPFNLFLADYETLTESGLEAVCHLKSDSSAYPDLKVIMLVPFMREDIFQKIDELGIDLGITKPIIPSVLYNGIIEIFDTKEPELKKMIPILGDQQSRMAGREYLALVVEDNKTNQFIMKEILEQTGFRVSLTDNGEEGVRYYREHKDEVDLILMDLHMPVMNGYEATTLIRETDPDVPIIAMTADAITGIDAECRRVGIDHYVSKPFEPDRLLETLLNILESGSRDLSTKETAADNEAPGISAAEREAALDKPAFLVLDTDDGLKRLGNNKELYQMILREYMIEFQDIEEELSQSIDLRNYNEAIQIVHKNKGGSGNIGARKLSVTAAELQKALAEGTNERVEMLKQEFLDQTAILMDEIKAYTEQPRE